MPEFCANRIKNDGRYNEVHDLTADACPTLPHELHRIPLGWHASCSGALLAARGKGLNPDGCWHCARECHRG